MKKKYMLMGIAAVLILATMVGGTLAALNTKTEKAVANISIKSVGVTMIGDQPVALADGGEKEPVTIVPGETIVMPKAVQNDIPDGYDVYVKVVIYHAWDTKSGGLVSAGEADDIYVHNQDWIIGYEDDEQTVMYYTKPLAPEQTTTNFMDGIHFKESMGNGFADAVYTLEYEVTAVQANNAKDAIAAELGVFPEFDENGTILSVSETR